MRERCSRPGENWSPWSPVIPGATETDAVDQIFSKEMFTGLLGEQLEPRRRGIADHCFPFVLSGISALLELSVSWECCRRQRIPRSKPSVPGIGVKTMIQNGW